MFKKIFAQTNFKKLFPCFLLLIFLFSGLKCKSLIYLSWFCVWYEIVVHFHNSACGYPVFPELFIEKTILFLRIQLCILGPSSSQRSVDHKWVSLFLGSKFCSFDVSVCVCMCIQIGFPYSSTGKESACNVGDPGSIPGQEDPLEKG